MGGVKSRRWGGYSWGWRSLSVVSLWNNYSWVYWTPITTYLQTVRPRQFMLQLFLTLIGTIVALYLVASQLIVVAKSPIIDTITVTSPSPQDIVDLYAQQDSSDGAITSLTCPCTTQSVPIATVSQWSVKEDSFCSTMQDVSTPPYPFDPPRSFGIGEFIALLNDPANEFCIGEPGDTGWDQLIAAVTKVATDGDLFPRDTNFNTAIIGLATRFQFALCGLAFGTIPQSAFYPFAIQRGTTTLLNECARVSNGETPNFLPSIVGGVGLDGDIDWSDTEEAFPQLQQTRALTLMRATVELCSSISLLRAGFLRSAPSIPLVTPNSISPDDLGVAVEQLWRTSLEARSAQANGFVPGSSAQDSIAPLTDPASTILSTFADSLRPPIIVPLDAFTFSSRLPFVRADYLIGGTQAYYVTAKDAGGNNVFAILAGEARVRAETREFGGFPSLQTDPPFTTPGFDLYDEAQAWVPLGSDFLSLLDACASGIPLSVDVHNVRPINGVDADIIADLDPPLNTLTIDDAVNGPLCGVGYGRPPKSEETDPPIPQGVLFNLPLRCPPLLQWLGGVRRNSTYFNTSSPVRITNAEFRALFPTRTKLSDFNEAQQRAVKAVFRGDSAERSDLLNVLLLDAKGGVNFTHSPLAYYASCAPAACTYTTIDPQTFDTIALEAVSIYGGTATTVIGAMGFLALIVSFIVEECVKHTVEEGEEGGGGKWAHVQDSVAASDWHASVNPLRGVSSAL